MSQGDFVGFDISLAREEFEIYLGASVDAADYWHVVPAWGYLAHAIRALCRHHPQWCFNFGRGGRLWVAREGVFLAWEDAWEDIKLLLGRGHPAKWSDHRIVARQLLVEDAIISSSAKNLVSCWMGRPSIDCGASDGRSEKLAYAYLVNVKNPFSIFDSIPEPVVIEFKGV